MAGLIINRCRFYVIQILLFVRLDDVQTKSPFRGYETDSGNVLMVID